MTTLLQLSVPAFICWLLWMAFRPRKHNGGSSASDGTPGSGCDSASHGGCGGHGGSCDGGGDGGGGD